MIVMKFGGTSVEDGAAISRVIQIIRKERQRTPLVVVSACSGVTNDLIGAAHAVRDGDEKGALAVLDALRDRHGRLIEELIPARNRKKICAGMDEMFEDLRNVVRGVHLLGELTRRSTDAMTGCGERLSSLILHAALEDTGFPAVLVDARQVMLTDKNYGSAQPQMEKVNERVNSILRPLVEQGSAVVIQGFIGGAEDGTTTTIGRGGSDLSAAIFGSLLGAGEIQIWTDVDGMMTADPRIIPESRPIGIMSFDEASELAYFGAKVLHPRTILPAIRKNIPVRVLNSRRPDFKGTSIVRMVPEEQRSGDRENVIKSIACKRGIVVINVASSRMLMAHGFLARLFSIFAEYEKSVDVVATSEVSVSLTVDSEETLPEITEELEQIGETRISRNKAILCVVGEGMKHAPGVGARIFGALARGGVNIEMVSEGASEINLTLVVDERDVEKAVRVLHDEFFPDPKRAGTGPDQKHVGTGPDEKQAGI